MTTKTKDKSEQQEQSNGQTEQPKPSFDFDALLSDDNITEVEGNTVATKTEDDVPEKLRKLVDASYRDGKYRRVAVGTKEAADELLKLARLYGQVRKAGQVTIRTSKSDNPAVLIFRAKDKETRPRYTVGTRVRDKENADWVGTITSTDDKDNFSIEWDDGSESVEARSRIVLADDENGENGTE